MNDLFMIYMNSKDYLLFTPDPANKMWLTNKKRYLNELNNQNENKCNANIHCKVDLKEAFFVSNFINTSQSKII